MDCDPEFKDMTVQAVAEKYEEEAEFKDNAEWEWEYTEGAEPMDSRCVWDMRRRTVDGHGFCCSSAGFRVRVC